MGPLPELATENEEERMLLAIVKLGRDTLEALAIEGIQPNSPDGWTFNWGPFRSITHAGEFIDHTGAVASMGISTDHTGPNVDRDDRIYIRYLDDNLGHGRPEWRHMYLDLVVADAVVALSQQQRTK